LWCEELKQHRLSTLEDDLKRKQPAYLREKAETLKWMKKEQEELNLEVTVTDEEMQECLRKAEKIEAELAEKDDERSKKVDQYYIYKPEVVQVGQVYE